MATRRLVDYYKILAVPADADLIGIENAYVRLSDELVRQAEFDDEGVQPALEQLNEAYAVLANAEARRQYDRVLFAAEYAALEKRLKSEARRRSVARGVLVGALLMIVLAQASVLAYMGRDYIDEAAHTVLGPLYPDEAS